jgi:hypothetical protein
MGAGIACTHPDSDAGPPAPFSAAKSVRGRSAGHTSVERAYPGTSLAYYSITFFAFPQLL